jgi:DNA-binding response OmpR family regulator
MGLDAASFQFLPKPYSTEELARRVRQVLDE